MTPAIGHLTGSRTKLTHMHFEIVRSWYLRQLEIRLRLPHPHILRPKFPSPVEQPGAPHQSRPGQMQ